MTTQVLTSRPTRTPPHLAKRCEAKPDAGVARGLEAIQARLDQLQREVRQAQQLAGLGRAAATIAHEVNNLLTPMLAYADAALAGNDVQLQRKALTITVKNVEILTAMSKRLLAVGAATTGEQESVCVRAVVEDAIGSLCRDLSKDGIRLAMRIDEGLMVWVDRVQLHQVLFNLLLNATEAMSKGHDGRLTVAAGRQGDQVRLEVTNTGDPIPPKLLPHIFEPFRSGKTQDGNGSGRCRGLGLALCRDLIEENGGTISASSSAQRGTRFTIHLPAKSSEEAPVSTS